MDRAKSLVKTKKLCALRIRCLSRSTAILKSKIMLFIQTQEPSE